MNRGEKLTYYMELKGFTARDLSRAADVPYTTIRSMIERDLVNASIDNTLRICKALGISVEDIIGVRNEQSQLIAESRYPYITEPISAGLPSTVDCVEDITEITLPDAIMGKYANQKNIRIMRTNGESMNRVIPNGCLMAVKTIPIENIKDGDIVVYRDNYDYAVKRIYRSGNKVIFRPDSTDPTFTDYVTEADEQLNIIGKVVLYIVELD